MFATLTLIVLLTSPQGSDVALRGGRLESFLKSRGASEVGRDVRWSIPGGALMKPRRTRHGWSLFTHRGIGILVPVGLPAWNEVRRRGGVALLRGRVLRVPPEKRRPGDPAFALAVREMARRPP